MSKIDPELKKITQGVSDTFQGIKENIVDSF